MQYKIIRSFEKKDELSHYGVIGMKWGRRKSRASSGSSKKSSIKKKVSNAKSKAKKVISKVDKQKVKAIAKTSAKVAGGVAAVVLLGHVGSIAYSNILRQLENSSPVGPRYDHYTEVYNRETGKTRRKFYGNRW